MRKDQAETRRRSLITTCNQPFSAWDQIFPDAAMAVAAIDRLVRHDTILELNAERCRRRAAAKAGTKAKISTAA